jgi:hypothetical protein
MGSAAAFFSKSWQFSFCCFTYPFLFQPLLCSNISVSYERTGARPRALDAARESLRIGAGVSAGCTPACFRL